MNGRDVEGEGGLQQRLMRENPDLSVHLQQQPPTLYASVEKTKE